MRLKWLAAAMAAILLLSLPACQVRMTDLQTPTPGISAAPEGTGPAASAFEQGDLYDEITAGDDINERFNSDELTYMSEMTILGWDDSVTFSQYMDIFGQGPESWRGSAFETVILPEAEADEFKRLAQRFIFAVDDVQGPGFVRAHGKGSVCEEVLYTPQQIREAQRGWQRLIFSPSLFQGLEASGQDASWVPELLDNGLILTPVMMYIAVDHTVLRLTEPGEPERYAMLVHLWNNAYAPAKADTSFINGTLRQYLAAHPQMRGRIKNNGDTYQWIIAERDGEGRLAVTAWENNFLYNGVTDAVIYDETGVRTAWFDRTEGMLNGYDMTTLDFHEEEILTRRLYDKGVDFITTMYTLQGAEMTDGDFNAARVMMAPELIAAMDEDGFFDEYLMNIQNQDIRMTPYFAPDPMDDRITPHVEVYTQQPMQCLARLTKPGASDLYMISYCWNYEGFSSNVDRASPDDSRPLGTMDLSAQEGQFTGANWENDVRTGPGHLAILTFIGRDGQLQVVNWETRGR